MKTPDPKKRAQIEKDLVQAFAKSGRFEKINTREFFKELAGLFINAGVATPADRSLFSAENRQGRAEMGAALKAGYASGTVSHDEYADHLAGRAFDASATPGERAKALREMGALEARRQAQEERDRAKAEKEQEKAEKEADPTFAFEQKRDQARRDVSNRFLTDPGLRDKYGTDEQKKAEREELEKRGLLTEADAEKKKGANWGGLARTGLLAGLGVMHGVTSAFRSGAALGNAAGDLVKGLDSAVTGAASGLAHVGEGLAGLVLAPLGKAGQGAGAIAGALMNGLVGSVSAAGGVVAAGVKVGVGLAGGIMAGLGTLAGAGAGALVGGIIGSILPGGGTVAGAVLGAGIGSAVAGTVVQALSAVVGVVSSGLGQALSAIGSAFGALGKSIGDALGNVQSVLSDLISTGQAFAQAALAVQRGSGFSLGASAQVAGLSQVLTGGPGAFGATFDNFSMMGQYLPDRAAAFGGKASGKGFLDYVSSMFSRYQAYGDGPDGALQKQILLKVAFPGSESTIGGLFSLGPDMVAKALATAQKVAPTPRQLREQANLGFDLSVIGAQLDGLKLKLESALLPTLGLFVSAFSRLFAANEGKIVAGLERFGEWMYVKFPTAIEKGLGSLFSFAEAFTTAFPRVFAFTLTVLEGFVSTVQQIAGELAGPVGAFSPTAGAKLSAFSKIPMTGTTYNADGSVRQFGFGLETAQSQAQKDVADRRRAQADDAQAEAERIQGELKNGTKLMRRRDPETGRVETEETGLSPQEVAERKARLAELGATRRRLLAEAEAADAEAARINPLQQKVQAASDGADAWLKDNGPKAQGFLGGAWGTEAQRQRDWSRGAAGNVPPGSGKIEVNVHVSGEWTHKHEMDLARLRSSVETHMDNREFRQLQRSSS